MATCSVPGVCPGVLRLHFGTDDWSRWEPALAKREPAALASWRENCSQQIEYEQFVQYIFRRQWDALRQYASAKDVQFFGDMPNFVAHGSSDVWAHQRLFWLKPDG